LEGIAIVKAYVGVADSGRAKGSLRRNLDYAIEMENKARRS